MNDPRSELLRNAKEKSKKGELFYDQLPQDVKPGTWDGWEQYATAICDRCGVRQPVWESQEDKYVPGNFMFPAVFWVMRDHYLLDHPEHIETYGHSAETSWCMLDPKPGYHYE